MTSWPWLFDSQITSLVGYSKLWWGLKWHRVKSPRLLLKCVVISFVWRRSCWCWEQAGILTNWSSPASSLYSICSSCSTSILHITELLKVFLHSSLQCLLLCMLLTHADESWERACVYLFVHMIEPKRLKLQSPNLPLRYAIMNPGYPFSIRSKGHRVTKCKNIFQAIKWPAWVCTLWSGQHLVIECWYVWNLSPVRLTLVVCDYRYMT